MRTAGRGLGREMCEKVVGGKEPGKFEEQDSNVCSPLQESKTQKGRATGTSEGLGGAQAGEPLCSLGISRCVLGSV